MVLASVLVFIAFVYLGVIIGYLRGWRRAPEWTLPAGFEPNTRVTVIVAARNESEHIGPCLQSIVNGSYPVNLLEIIVVDDFSEDETANLVRQFKAKHASGPSIRLLQLSELLLPENRSTANKKQAIEQAVNLASGDIVVTTDADCLVPPDWLRLLVSCFSANAHWAILTAPVVFYREKNLLQYFQSLDFLGLMGITAGGIHLGWHRMGNGANLAYRKAAFIAVGGFSGNEQVASGDDMFLIQKMAAKWPDGVGFLKNPAASVRTQSKDTWREFWQQRLRWGTKNAALPEWRIKAILLMVLVYCWSIWLSLALVVCRSFHWQIWICLMLVKAVADWLLLSEMCRFFNRKDLMGWFWPSFFIHTASIAAIGLFGLFFKKYEWKGRIVQE